MPLKCDSKGCINNAIWRCAHIDLNLCSYHTDKSGINKRSFTIINW